MPHRKHHQINKILPNTPNIRVISAMCVILLCLFFFIAFATLHIPSASAEVQDASTQQQTTGDTNNDTSRALPQYEHALVKDGCEYYPGFLNKIVKCSRDFLLGSLQISGNGQNDGLTFEKLRDPLRSIVASLLIVYVVIFTIKVGIGAVDNGLFKEVAISLLFITFVVYFAMEGDMYFWMRIFVFTQEGMASIVINQLNTDMGIISDGCFSREDTWMRVDCTIYELIGYQEGKGFSGKTLGVAIVSGGLLLTPLGPIIAVTAMGMVALMILSFGQAAFNYIFAMMMVIILGFLSIIFIPCVLFEQTKDLFDFMLELLISFIITPAITLAYLTFMMIVLHYAVLCDDETCMRATYDKAREASKNYKPGPISGQSNIGKITITEGSQEVVKTCTELEEDLKGGKNIQSVLITDGSNKKIYGYNEAQRPKSPASLIKPLIADIFMNSGIPLNTKLVIPKDVVAEWEETYKKGVTGKTAKDALYDMLQNSSNTATNLIACLVGGGCTTADSSTTPQDALEKFNGIMKKEYTSSSFANYLSIPDAVREKTGTEIITPNKTTAEDVNKSVHNIYYDCGNKEACPVVKNAMQTEKDPIYRGKDRVASKIGANSRVLGSTNVLKDDKDYIVTVFANINGTDPNNDVIIQKATEIAKNLAKCKAKESEGIQETKPHSTATTLVAATEPQEQTKKDAMVKYINDTKAEDLPNSLQAIKKADKTTVCKIYQAVNELGEEEKSPIMDYLKGATNKKDVDAVETDIANLIKGCDNNSKNQHNKEFALSSRVNTASTLPASGVTCGHTDGIAVDTNLITGADDGVKITIHPDGEAILPKYFDGIATKYNEERRHILADANDIKSAYPKDGKDNEKNEWLQARISNVKASEDGGNKVFSYYTPLKSSSEASDDSGERKTEETAVYVTSLGGGINPVSGGKGVMLSDRAKQTLITVSSDGGVKKGQQVATCISGVNSNSPGQSGNNTSVKQLAMDKETQHSFVLNFFVATILLGFLKASMENVNQLGGRLAGLPSISFPGQNIIFRKI